MSEFKLDDLHVYWGGNELAIRVDDWDGSAMVALDKIQAKSLLEWLQTNQPADKEGET